MPAETEAPPWEAEQQSDAWAPPASEEAELGLLGAILANNAAYDQVSDFLRPDHFFVGINAKIFMACEALINRGETANAVTLAGLFENEPALEQVGGKHYLSQIQHNFVTIINAKDYGRTIHDCWLRRRTINIAAEMSDYAYQPGIDVDGPAIVERALDELTDLSESGQREGGLVGLSPLSRRVAEETEAIRKGEAVPGLPTGLVDLDRALAGGFQPGHLIVIGARPSMGKSALATNIARNVAAAQRRELDGEGQPVDQSQPVAFFSLEMPDEDLARRIACERAGIEFERTKQQDGMNEDEASLFMRECLALDEIPLFIDDTAGLTPMAIRSRALAFKRRHGLALVIIDYLQLMSAQNEAGNRNEQISAITKALKAMAKALGVPVVLLSQLSRALEQRDDKRPMLSDLRDSGTIEQDADVVIFLYREEYYLARKGEPQRREGEEDTRFYERVNGYSGALEAARNRGDIIIAKARNGKVCTVPAIFDAAMMRWGDLAHRQHEFEGY
ncbi:replicative DNA helicase [Pelagibius sp.]|uniref:replicative DNA helicase n=1 Tax=Pelagibius sp. TaxID=1931238 RepID=UPI003BAEC668